MDLKREKERVCIIGCASSKDLAPLADDSWEFWGVNNLFLHMPTVPWSKWFEIHSLMHDGKNYHRRNLIKDHVFTWSRDFRGQDVNEYVKGLSGLKCPVVMQGVWPEIPNSVVYPIQDVVQKFGTYLTNTVSYEIALALLMGYKEIGIFGVDMAVGSEYQNQRPSCEYFIGLAVGLGVKITIPNEADLCKTRFMYAFQDREAEAWEKKVQSMLASIRKQKKDAEMQLALHQKRLEQSIGAEMALMESDKIWGLYK